VITEKTKNDQAALSRIPQKSEYQQINDNEPNGNSNRSTSVRLIANLLRR
jgi:hypothetical protein